VSYIEEISNNDALYEELPDWAKEFDYFDTGSKETTDLDETEGASCLQEYL
jgi:hypothetical protein